MPTELLEEISGWKLEAKLEDSQRYFCFGRETKLALDGSRCFIIGRKGTGKTAISEHICRLTQPTVFSEKLTFKNFPFNELYGQKNDQFRAPNQYITIWKYLIYSFVCRMMARSESVSQEARNVLNKIYSTDPIVTLSRTFSQWTSREFSLSVLGTGLGVKLGRQYSTGGATVGERVDLLEDLILKYVDDSSYYVVFDELDEDFKDILRKGQNREYIDLLTSLFKAVQDVRSIFRGTGKKIFPIIFLRDDIYDFIQDPDKNKWGDFRIDMNWTQERIQDLLAFRISRAADPTSSPSTFQEAWDRVFYHKRIAFGDQRRFETTIFDYITRSTHLRPRDYIKFLQACAEHEVNGGFKQISAITVRKVDKAFSNYLRNEIVDEVQGMIPDINEVLNIFSEIRKQTLTQDEFRRAYVQRHKQGIVQIPDPDFVLRVLFHFSVIGNQPRQRNARVFHYLNQEARLNPNEMLIVHRGLFKALQIL